jgi:hypothetical protein
MKVMHWKQRREKSEPVVIKIKRADGKDLVWIVGDPVRGKKVIAAVRRILGKPDPMAIFIDAGQFG